MNILRRTCFLLLATCLFQASSAQVDALIYDGFDYPFDDSVPVDNNNVAGSDGGIGFGGPWANTRNSPDINSPGFDYGALITTGNML